MAVSCYLAMTAAEMQYADQLPDNVAYMACHFSPYATGLSNIPQALPPDAMLIVNDRTPISGHDPELIAQQLSQIVQDFSCSSVLLDFQRTDYPETQSLAAHLTHALPCPVGVSELYAQGLNCPVFLSSIPLNQRLDIVMALWQDREIWLEAAPDTGSITVTANGSTYRPLPLCQPPEDCFIHDRLYCKYRTKVLPDSIEFMLYRDAAILQELLTAGEAAGITKFIGLYQQREHLTN